MSDDQLVLASCKHDVELPKLMSQLAEAWATTTTMQQTQNALIAQVEPPVDGAGKK